MINSYITLSELFCFPHSIEFPPSNKKKCMTFFQTCGEVEHLILKTIQDMIDVVCAYNKK